MGETPWGYLATLYEPHVVYKEKGRECEWKPEAPPVSPLRALTLAERRIRHFRALKYPVREAYIIATGAKKRVWTLQRSTTAFDGWMFERAGILCSCDGAHNYPGGVNLDHLHHHYTCVIAGIEAAKIIKERKDRKFEGYYSCRGMGESWLLHMRKLHQQGKPVDAQAFDLLMALPLLTHLATTLQFSPSAEITDTYKEPIK